MQCHNPDEYLTNTLNPEKLCSNTAGNNLDVMPVHTAYYTTDTEQKPTDSAMLRNSAHRYTVKSLNLISNISSFFNY